MPPRDRLRIIIDHGQTRRKIVGSFNFIGDPYALRDIAKQILQQVGEHDDAPWVYGTVFICEKHVGVTDREPKEWDA